MIDLEERNSSLDGSYNLCRIREARMYPQGC